MTEAINGGGSRGYNTTIPSLSDNADIVSALKIYHYGSDVNSGVVSTSSIAGYLGNTVDKTLIGAKGDIFVGTANDTPGIVSFPAGVTDDYILVTKSAETTGVKWVQTNYQQDQVSYVMGLY
jgi:hypothetical protein